MRPRHRSGTGAGEAGRAVVDIGSNTVRLVIYGGPPRAPEVLFNEKVTAKLGRGVTDGGRLSAKSVNVALGALRRYAMLIDLRGIGTVDTVATAAARDAEDGREFLAAVGRIGLSPRLLSGEEEAITSASGVAGAFPGAKGLVADLGGGSLELVHIDGLACEHGVSLPLGSLRLPQMRAAGGARFARRVRKMVRSAEWASAPEAALYLVGGSFRAFARYAALQTDWPLDDPHGFTLAPDVALKLCARLRRGKTPPVVPGLPASRQASLADTAALLSALLREVRPSRIVFSSWGLREGLLFRAMAADVQAQDPLLAGVTAFVATLGIDADTAAMAAGWTADTGDGGGQDEALRLAATMLALAAQRLEPNLRADVATGWALRKRWIGIDAEGRAMLAACVLAAIGRPATPDYFARLASPARLSRAQTWGLAVRLCRRLTGLSPRPLANTALTRRPDDLVLTVRDPYHALCVDMIEKDLRQLAERLGLQPAVRLIGAKDALDQ